MIRQALLTAMFVMSAGAAMAQPMPPAPPGGGAMEQLAVCRADVQRFCQGIRPGQGRIRACMRSNQDRISQACRDAIKAVIDQRRARREQRLRGEAPMPPRPN